MTAYEYIVSRQILWAQRRGIRLGSQYRHDEDPAKRRRGRKFFVLKLEDNLFERPTEAARRAFEEGDGGELHPDKPGDGNMYALHSSSAAGYNLFHYWHARNELAPITAALGLPSARAISLCFEARYPIVEGDRRFPRPPNLDVEIKYEGGGLSVAAGVSGSHSAFPSGGGTPATGQAIGGCTGSRRSLDEPPSPGKGLR